MTAMQIVPGRLVERTCPDCGHVERRAFGESESARGELASYAIGWTSGPDHDVAYMTIGIGAGNEGGGTFHIELRPVDGEWAMGLVDRPFEDVPEGGPDLTREQALAHDDLDYVWFVADNVVEQDLRAHWLLHWLLGTQAFVPRSVVDDPSGIVRVLRDEEGDWQLFDADGSDEAAAVFHLFHALDADPTLVDVLDLQPGEVADRAAPRTSWARGTLD